MYIYINLRFPSLKQTRLLFFLNQQHYDVIGDLRVQDSQNNCVLGKSLATLKTKIEKKKREQEKWPRVNADASEGVDLFCVKEKKMCSRVSRELKYDIFLYSHNFVLGYTSLCTRVLVLFEQFLLLTPYSPILLYVNLLDAINLKKWPTFIVQ